MKIHSRTLPCLLVFAAIIATGANGAETPIPLSAPADEVRVTADCSQIVNTMRGGVGASWHAIENPIVVVNGQSHGGSAWGGHPPADDGPAWQRIYDHADWLGFDFVRVEIEQRMFEPERGRFTWDTPEMRTLYRILDWCERRHADVFLQQMWSNVAWNAFPEFRDDPVKRVRSGPRSMDDFTDGLAALMKHLTRTKGYTCIRWLCITNEPAYRWQGWFQQPPNEPLPLRDGLVAIRRALDRENICVPLSGPDWTDLPALYPARVDFDEFIGTYDLHSYQPHFDWRSAERDKYSLAEAEQRLRGWKQWAAERHKPLFLTEVGTMACGWGASEPSPATFEAALKDAELVVRASTRSTSIR